MSWHYVYNYVKARLLDPNFLTANAEHNPNTPEAAIALALENLAAEYRCRDKASQTERQNERIASEWTLRRRS